MQVSPRALPYLVVPLLLWVMWIYGASTQTPFRSLAVLLFDMLGAFILIRLSSKLPAALRLSVLGLGVALLAITIGDSNITYSLFMGIPRLEMVGWRLPFYYLGSFLVAVSAVAFPFAMQRQGLYPSTRALTLVISSLTLAVVLTAIIAWLTQAALPQSIYLFVTLLLTALFGAQTIALGTGRLAQTLRQLSLVFVMASLARLFAIFIIDTTIADIIYDLLWCIGLSLAAWMMVTREQ